MALQLRLRLHKPHILHIAARHTSVAKSYPETLPTILEHVNACSLG